MKRHKVCQSDKQETTTMDSRTHSSQSTSHRMPEHTAAKHTRSLNFSPFFNFYFASQLLAPSLFLYFSQCQTTAQFVSAGISSENFLLINQRISRLPVFLPSQSSFLSTSNTLLPLNLNTLFCFFSVLSPFTLVNSKREYSRHSCTTLLNIFLKNKIQFCLSFTVCCV